MISLVRPGVLEQKKNPTILYRTPGMGASDLSQDCPFIEEQGPPVGQSSHVQ